MDEAVDVLDAHGLGVQIDHRGGFMMKHGVVKIIRGGIRLIVRHGTVVAGGSNLAGCCGVLEGLPLANSKGVDLLGNVGGLLLGLSGPGEGFVARGLGLLALGLSSLGGGGSLGGEGGVPAMVRHSQGGWRRDQGSRRGGRIG